VLFFGCFKLEGVVQDVILECYCYIVKDFNKESFRDTGRLYFCAYFKHLIKCEKYVASKVFFIQSNGG